MSVEFTHFIYSCRCRLLQSTLFVYNAWHRVKMHMSIYNEHWKCAAYSMKMNKVIQNGIISAFGQYTNIQIPRYQTRTKFHGEFYLIFFFFRFQESEKNKKQNKICMAFHQQWQRSMKWNHGLAQVNYNYIRMELNVLCFVLMFSFSSFFFFSFLVARFTFLSLSLHSFLRALSSI